MPYRRRRSTFSRSRFRRRGTRPIVEPQRWEAANFYFEQRLTAAAGLVDVVAFDVMHVGHFSAFGTEGQILTDAMRTVEVGGIVWETSFSDPVPGQSTATARWCFHEVLATDRMDQAYTPVSLGAMDWTITQSPVSGSSTGGADADFPVRIHKRRFSAGSIPLAAAAPVQAALVPIFPHVYGPQKVRLKGSLGDRQGLFFFVQLTNLIATAGALAVTCHIAGTLYYRARF